MSDTATGPARPAEPTGFGRRPTADKYTAFEYDGRLGELYWIFIKNILLMIVTLSIWRFWGKTRIRRYLWSHTSLAGDRFEYTGTGGELFVGFIIVMVAYVAGSIGIQVLGVLVDPGSPLLAVIQVCLAFVILYLTFVAQYAAQRYRLTRTLWRGISGGMTGSAWNWGFKGMWFSILSLLSLTLAWPWAQMRLLSDRINNSYFGDAKASAELESKGVYRAYFTSILAMVGGLVVLGAIYVGVAASIGGNIGLDVMDFDVLRQWKYANEFILTWVIVAYVSFLLIGAVAFSFYVVAIAREVAGKMTLGDLHFATDVSVGSLMWRYVSNILIIVLTLGFGLPIAIHRTMLFLSRNILVVGEIDGSEITRADLPRPKFGEGLLEAFDPGIL